MELPDEVVDDLRKRLRRADGQVRAVERMLAEGRECKDIVTQLSAVSKALDRAGFAMVASGMRDCLTNPNSEESVDVAALEKLFLSLS